jgi:hypothetical protein
MTHNHYYKDVSGLQQIDVYRVIELFDVPAGPIDHAVKKLLCAGNRGHKDLDRDIQDAIDSLVRWQAMRAEDAKVTEALLAELGGSAAFGVRDPRTVAGVDVAFDTEKYLNFAPTELAFDSGDCKSCGVSVLFPHREGCKHRSEAQRGIA